MKKHYLKTLKYATLGIFIIILAMVVTKKFVRPALNIPFISQDTTETIYFEKYDSQGKVTIAKQILTDDKRKIQNFVDNLEGMWVTNVFDSPPNEEYYQLTFSGSQNYPLAYYPQSNVIYLSVFVDHSVSIGNIDFMKEMFDVLK
jgi:hypothetical protein